MSEGINPPALREGKTKTPPILVRRLDRLDWEAFRELRLDALRSDPLAFGSSFEGESAYSPEKWRNWCRDGAAGGRSVTFVAASPPSELVGMVGVFFADESPHVWGMWTRPKWRNRGVGRQLMGRLLAWLDRYRPDRPVVLDVNPTQVAAERIYTSLGFRFTGVEEPLGHHPPAVVRQMVRVRHPPATRAHRLP
jgi:RimJ/RimL family protein N-acetyltransferase